MKVVDLSQPLSQESQVHPLFFSPLILRHWTHQEQPPNSAISFKTNVLITSNHAGTHVDSLSHFDARPSAPDIYEMPLDDFVGEAVCVDCRDVPPKHYIAITEFEQLLADQHIAIKSGDIVLFCTDHYNRTAGTPAFLTDFSGVSGELVHWLADQGVKSFGTETVSPDLVTVTDQYPAHRACAECGITHFENLNNLKDVAGERFLFVGAPLPVPNFAGSPVRAVGILDYHPRADRTV